MNLTLTGSAFVSLSNHPLGTHKDSWWQVDVYTGNFSAPVFDSGWDAVHLTSIVATVADGQIYQARVKYRDNLELESSWAVAHQPFPNPSVPRQLIQIQPAPIKLEELRLGPLSSQPDFTTAHNDTVDKVNELVRAANDPITWDDVVNKPEVLTPETLSASLTVIDWADIINQPTTLSGYGITDAYTKPEVDALIAAVPSSGSSTALLVFGTNGAEAGDTIKTILQVLGSDGVTLIATDLVEIEVKVTDGADDFEVSSTARLVAGAVGLLLSGTGTARAAYRTSILGAVEIAVTETVVAHRYLWVKMGANSRVIAMPRDGVHELVFT